MDAHATHRMQFGIAPGIIREETRLLLVEVLVGANGERHEYADREAVLARIIMSRVRLARSDEVSIDLGVRELGGVAALAALVDETCAAARDVDHLADQVGFDPLREIIEVEVEVVDTASQFGGEVIAQVFRVEVVEIAARLDEGPARFRHLLPVHGEKAVGEDGGGRAETRALEHGRPEQGVEVDDVFADEVIELGPAVLAPILVEGDAAPLAIGLEARHVTDGRVEPHVKILAGGVWDFKAEIGCVARDVPYLQARFEPFIELVADLRLQMAAAGPAAAICR